MKKHFLIKSIHKNKRKGEAGGWIEYDIVPITKGIKTLLKMIGEYNEGNEKPVTLEIYGVKGDETAVITLCGPRARVKYFPTALADTNFYEYFSLCEVECPEIYI
jgi:hypothetical protein